MHSGVCRASEVSKIQKQEMSNKDSNKDKNT